MRSNPRSEREVLLVGNSIVQVYGANGVKARKAAEGRTYLSARGQANGYSCIVFTMVSTARGTSAIATPSSQLRECPGIGDASKVPPCVSKVPIESAPLSDRCPSRAFVKAQFMAPIFAATLPKQPIKAKASLLSVVVSGLRPINWPVAESRNNP